jgi:hypothetical protein
MKGSGRLLQLYQTGAEAGLSALKMRRESPEWLEWLIIQNKQATQIDQGGALQISASTLVGDTVFIRRRRVKYLWVPKMSSRHTASNSRGGEKSAPPHWLSF